MNSVWTNRRLFVSLKNSTEPKTVSVSAPDTCSAQSTEISGKYSYSSKTIEKDLAEWVWTQGSAALKINVAINGIFTVSVIYKNLIIYSETRSLNDIGNWSLMTHIMLEFSGTIAGASICASESASVKI